MGCALISTVATRLLVDAAFNNLYINFNIITDHECSVIEIFLFSTVD